MNVVQAEGMERVGELPTDRRLMDRRIMFNFSTEQIKRLGIQVAEHFMRDDREGAWQLMQTYNLSGQGHYQLMAFALQRLGTYSGDPDRLFINWMANIHLK